MRLFVAVDLSDDIRDKLYSVIRRIEGFRGIKTVERENIHITLMFLGDVKDRNVEIVRERLREVEMRRFKIRLRGIGFFPSRDNIRVIWAGVEDGKDELKMLADKIERNLKKLGFKRDKEFVAHATIARAKRLDLGNRLKILRILEEFSDKEFGIMDVEDFRLKKSTLTPKGPIYEDLEVYRLI